MIIADATIMATIFGLVAGDIVGRGGTCAAGPYVDDSSFVFNVTGSGQAPDRGRAGITGADAAAGPFNKAAAGFGNP
jgi:hypothetical protein